MQEFKHTLLVICALGATAQNPFQSPSYYVNPSFQSELDDSIASATGETKQVLRSLRNVASAYWIDQKTKITGNTTESLEGILLDATSHSPVPLVVLILYNLPNRDCSAKASNGEICCYYNGDGTCDYGKSGDCAEGLAEYQSEYVDAFAATVGRFAATVPIAVIIEPDSLPNLATNTGNPHCGNAATRAAYTRGIPYAVKALAAAAPSAALYADAAHGGWLGWQSNAQAYAELVAGLGVSHLLRGFSSNVANYQPLGQACPEEAFEPSLPAWCQQHASAACCADPCGVLGQYSSGNNELNYVQVMSAELRKAMPSLAPRWVIDTGRNGVTGMRQSCSNFCNIRGAGVGALPSANSSSLPSLVDGNYWLKTPGESDGCTQELPSGGPCARFDSMCASVDSIGSRSDEPKAPEAGAWFDYQIKQLAAEATPERSAPGGAKPFAKCGGAGSAAGCPSEHTCEGSAALRLCMPSAALVAQAGHSGPFATSLAHARARLQRPAAGPEAVE